MKTPTVNDVIDYLKHDRTLFVGKNLYNKFPTKSLAIQAGFNRMIDTEDNVKRLCYELCKLAGVSERKYTVYMNQPVVDKPVEQTDDSIDEPVVLTTEEKLLQLNPAADKEVLLKTAAEIEEYKNAALPEVPEFSKGLAGNREMKAFLKEKGVEHEATKNDDLEQEIEKWQEKAGFDAKMAGLQKMLDDRQNLIAEKTAAMPTAAKEKIKLWQQFPFLREKDCPDIYKILVNDMITAYHTYMETQPKLHEALTDEDRKAIADTVKDNFMENKQIWAELEYYQKNRKVLGEHPIFEQQKAEEEIAELDTPALTKKISSLENNVRRNTAKANDEKRDAGDRDKSKTLAEFQQGLLDFAKDELGKRK
ncbi:hypothetical protein ACH3O9_11335 [Leeuwenhoekiella sp. A16]|uniref:hypothetical protein n=1 Tax=Leeuwenhoekiella sp. A16 TaxID=3141462 RepID=UPI003A801DB2